MQGRDIVVVHTSDVHVDHVYTAQIHGGDGAAGLACVLDAARDLAADVVLLAGDTFDCHRLPDTLVDHAAAVIAAAEIPVVLLPGNHDPVVPDAVFHRPSFAAAKNLHIIGIAHEEAILFPELDLEIWGRPHRDYDDMIPFETVRPRRTRWQIAAAHGHYVPVAGSQRPAAAVLAVRRRRSAGDRRRLCRARPLECARQGGQWRGRRLLLRLAGICRHIQCRPARRSAGVSVTREKLAIARDPYAFD